MKRQTSIVVLAHGTHTEFFLVYSLLCLVYEHVSEAQSEERINSREQIIAEERICERSVAVEICSLDASDH